MIPPCRKATHGHHAETNVPATEVSKLTKFYILNFISKYFVDQTEITMHVACLLDKQNVSICPILILLFMMKT